MQPASEDLSPIQNASPETEIAESSTAGLEASAKGQAGLSNAAQESDGIVPAMWEEETAATQPKREPIIVAIASQRESQPSVSRDEGVSDKASSTAGNLREDLSEKAPMPEGGASSGGQTPRIPFGLAKAGGSGMDFFDGQSFPCVLLQPCDHFQSSGSG